MTDFKPGSEVWVKATFVALSGSVAYLHIEQGGGFIHSTYAALDQLLDPASWEGSPSADAALMQTVDQGPMAPDPDGGP